MGGRGASGGGGGGGATASAREGRAGITSMLDESRATGDRVVVTMDDGTTLTGSVLTDNNSPGSIVSIQNTEVESNPIGRVVGPTGLMPEGTSLVVRGPVRMVSADRIASVRKYGG